jgi:hypothetical protein
MEVDLNDFRHALAEGRSALGDDAGPTARPATRSGGHVAPIHRFVARELSRQGIPADWLAPDPRREDGRYWPSGVRRAIERIEHSRLAMGSDALGAIERVGASLRRSRRKPLGAYHAKEVDVSATLEDAGPLIVVSVKAPVSSVAKNAVNRYEEGIGEATNLHTRFPMLVFGFLMVLPCVDELYTPGRGATSGFRNIASLIAATSVRDAITDPPGAYEAAGLVLVDYAHDPPVPVADAPDPSLRIDAFFRRIIELHRVRNRALG